VVISTEIQEGVRVRKIAVDVAVLVIEVAGA
jgi:hypothetical protein